MRSSTCKSLSFRFSTLAIFGIAIAVSTLFEMPSAHAQTASTQITSPVTQVRAKRVRGRPRTLGSLGSR